MARRARRWTHCLAALALAGCVDLARPDRRRTRPAAAASQRAEAASERRFRLTDEERRGAWTLLDRLGSRYRVAGRLRVLTRRDVTRAAETLLPSPIVDAHRGSHGWVFALESGALFTSPTYLATPREIVPPSCAPGDRRVVFQPSHDRLSIRGLDGAWRWSDGRSWGRVTVADANTVAWFGERGAAIVRHRTLWFTDDGGSRWREVPLGGEVAGWVGGRADGLFVLTDQGLRRIADDGRSVGPTRSASFDAEAQPWREHAPLPDALACDGYALAHASACILTPTLAAPAPLAPEPRALLLSVPLREVETLRGVPLPAGTTASDGDTDLCGNGAHLVDARLIGDLPERCDHTFRGVDARGPFTLRLQTQDDFWGTIIWSAPSPQALAASRAGFIFRSVVEVSNEGYLWEHHWQGRDGLRAPILAVRFPFRWETSVVSLSDESLLLVARGRAVLGPMCSGFPTGCGDFPPLLVEALHLSRDGRILARRAEFREHDAPLGVGGLDGATGLVVRDAARGDALTLLPVTGGERPFVAWPGTGTLHPCGPAAPRRATFHPDATTAAALVRFEGSTVDPGHDPTIAPTHWTLELDPSAPTPTLCLRQVVAHARVVDARGHVSHRLLWVDARDGRLTATLDTGTRYLPVPITFTTEPAASPPP